jgi:hypothetical protein
MTLGILSGSLISIATPDCLAPAKRIRGNSSISLLIQTIAESRPGRFLAHFYLAFPEILEDKMRQIECGVVRPAAGKALYFVLRVLERLTRRLSP